MATGSSLLEAVPGLTFTSDVWGIGRLGEYVSEEQIGEGTYGQVFKARHRRTNDSVALKKMVRHHEREGFPKTETREIKILRSIAHVNMVNLREVVSSLGSSDAAPSPADPGARVSLGDRTGDVFMVFDYVDYDLAGLINSGYAFSAAQAKAITYQLLVVLDFLHGKGYVHRDLKCSNVLLTDGMLIKLADFGLARSTLQGDGKLSNNVITLWYRPPELLLGDVEYTASVDMWSVGCIIYEVLTGKPAFPARTEAHALVSVCAVVGTPPQGSWMRSLPVWTKTAMQDVAPCLGEWLHTQPVLRDPEVVYLLSKLLEVDPRKRISAKEALRSKWFDSEPRINRAHPMDGLPAVSAAPGFERTVDHHEYATKRRRHEVEVVAEMTNLNHEMTEVMHGVSSVRRDMPLAAAQAAAASLTERVDAMKASAKNLLKLRSEHSDRINPFMSRVEAAEQQIAAIVAAAQAPPPPPPPPPPFEQRLAALPPNRMSKSVTIPMGSGSGASRAVGADGGWGSVAAPAAAAVVQPRVVGIRMGDNSGAPSRPTEMYARRAEPSDMPPSRGRAYERDGPAVAPAAHSQLGGGWEGLQQRAESRDLPRASRSPERRNAAAPFGAGSRGASASAWEVTDARDLRAPLRRDGAPAPALAHRERTGGALPAFTAAAPASSRPLLSQPVVDMEPARVSALLPLRPDAAPLLRGAPDTDMHTSAAARSLLSAPLLPASAVPHPAGPLIPDARARPSSLRDMLAPLRDSREVFGTETLRHDVADDGRRRESASDRWRGTQDDDRGDRHRDHMRASDEPRLRDRGDDRRYDHAGARRGRYDDVVDERSRDERRDRPVSRHRSRSRSNSRGRWAPSDDHRSHRR